MADRNEAAENKRKHLEMIQGVISRMGGNLFYLRGWSITLTAGLLAIFTSQKKLENLRLFPLFILGVVTGMFWIYDGYFLALERKYRCLYNEVSRKKPEDVDFSMDVSKFNKEVDNKVIFCMFSKTLAPFYLFLLGVTVYLIVTANG